MVILSRAPVLTFRSSGAALCGFRGFETGSLANVVNFVRYDIRRLTSASYGPLYAASAGDPFDASRTELVRAELDTDGKEIAGTQELVAEYAVDLKLGITVVNSVLNATDPTLLTLAPGDANIGGWAGPTDPELAVNRGPHLVRAIRVRLGIRSREADRKEKISTEPGLFRIGLGPNGGAPFARVRTLQADIALRNQTRPTWGL
jgi:hypothetical protein